MLCDETNLSFASSSPALRVSIDFTYHEITGVVSYSLSMALNQTHAISSHRLLVVRFLKFTYSEVV